MESPGGFFIAVFAVLFAFISCSIDRSVIHCSDGDRKSCTCEDGTKGFKACNDGVFEECACEADASYVDVGEKDDGSVAEDEKKSRTTVKDSGEHAPATVDSGGTDTDLDATDFSDAEDPSDSEQRDVPLSDASVDSDIADTGDVSDAGDDAEQDSSDYDSGKDAGNDAGWATVVYGQCEQDECSGDQQCTVVFGGIGTYCSIECEETEQCPVPTTGTAVRRCSALDGMCRLNCANGDCPDDMECFRTGARATCVFPQPTEVYGRCNGGECSGDQECTVVINGTGTYCSIECEETEQCPVATSGTAERRCNAGDGMCRLDCQNGDCPAGMECFQAVVRSTCVWE